MVRSSIYLTEKQRSALRELAQQTGQKQSELIRRAIDEFIDHHKARDRRARLGQAWGIWKDRDDLPDFQALRKEFDR
ncbi:MAG: ribbon-helix-helix domain-containing protein [Syntrophales bacterium]|nr:ribbon-helix-helix domain-containing protein [Syntrophales bacterium]MDD5641460.1 ribbon-helix-helix domain-containing protein [Syntrophales bacterium]